MPFCPICGGNSTSQIYCGKIRAGAPGQMTGGDVAVRRCDTCRAIWHGGGDSSCNALYESDDYRRSMGETASLAEFCRRHDGETLGKLDCTGTAVYRGKLFMDVGCGGGGYADFVRGVARQVVLVEPNASFASQLREAGHEVFAYPEDALGKYCGKIELLASFDVIEHVAVPQGFLNAIHSLLAPGGQAFVGTPTDYPVLRGLLGGAFDSFVFSVQHPWVFSSESLELMAGKCGFSRFEAKPRQRFGLGNLVAWLLEREPRGEAAYDFITPALDACYKSEMAKHGTAEYLVLELVK